MSFNFTAAVNICSDFGARENKVCHCFHCFPIYLTWSDGTGCHDLSFLNVESTFLNEFSEFSEWKSQLFHSPLSLSSKGSLILLCFLIRVVSSVYLRLLIFLSAVLISACASSNPVFLMRYSASKLNKQSDNIQPWCLLSQFGTSPLFYVWF